MLNERMEIKIKKQQQPQNQKKSRNDKEKYNYLSNRQNKTKQDIWIYVIVKMNKYMGKQDVSFLLY